MLFVLQGIDRPASSGLRERARVPHLEFVARHADAFRFGGPLIGVGGNVVGSLMIVDLPDAMALERHLASDPFFGCGLFERIEKWATRQVVPETSPGALRCELERQRHTVASA